MEDRWKWSFSGFESMEDNRPVQAWFNGLNDEDREVIVDTLVYLQNITTQRWPESSFDPLAGAGGISEIKCAEFRTVRDGIPQRITLRIYGFFGPPNRKHSYTLLHGVDKKKRNDEEGKKIGKQRLDQVLSGEATTHEFDFE